MPPEYIVSERPAVFSHRRSALRTAQTVRFFKPPSLEGFFETMRPETGVLRYLAMENDERVWPVSAIVQTARSLGVPAITDAFHHGLNPGGLTLREALDLSLPTWELRRARPKVHLSSQDPHKQAGAHAYSVDLGDWYALLDVLDGREADVMVEAKGKEQVSWLLLSGSSNFPGR